MHELSIAQSIVDLVTQYVPDKRSGVVRSARVKVGRQSGVVVDSLEFCFAAITKDTDLDGVLLEIESIPFVVWCNDCSTSFQNDEGTILCPQCGGGNTRVTSGTELQLVEIEVNDDPREVS
jgi:hydrogenase nickel incorporation protein HypA/HybF